MSEETELKVEAAPSATPIVSGSSVSDPPAQTPVAESTDPPVLAIAYVANTDGEGVYLRRSPNLDDRITAIPERTRLEIVGSQFTANNTQWFAVRAPDGQRGFVPATYLADRPPPTPTIAPSATLQPTSSTLSRTSALGQSPASSALPSRTTDRASLESYYVLTAENAGYSSADATARAKSLSDAQLHSDAERYSAESYYILTAQNAGYTRDDATRRARTLTPDQLQAGAERNNAESYYILTAVNAAHPRDWATQRARSLSDDELRSGAQRFSAESFYILQATNRGEPRQAAIDRARNASDAELAAT